MNYKKSPFYPKKVDYEYFKMAILVNDLRQFPSFSLLLCRFVGRSCLNSPPRYLIIMHKCPAILPDDPK